MSSNGLQPASGGLRKLFRSYPSDVCCRVPGVFQHPAAVDGITIETFLAYLPGQGSFDPSREFGAWARRISTNACIHYLKTPRLDARLIRWRFPKQDEHEKRKNALAWRGRVRQ